MTFCFEILFSPKYLYNLHDNWRQLKLIAEPWWGHFRKNVGAKQAIKMDSETELRVIRSKFMKISQVGQEFIENSNINAM
jgi:hypothetical protein